MTRHIVGVVAGLVTWFVLASAGGFVMREGWPAYAQVAASLSFAREAEAPAFTLLMLLARLLMGALATVGMGFVTARITPSTLVRLIPGVLWLLFFIVEHVAVWDKFPVWYHLVYLLTFLPLTYAGNLLGGRSRFPQAASVA